MRQTLIETNNTVQYAFKTQKHCIITLELMYCITSANGGNCGLDSYSLGQSPLRPSSLTSSCESPQAIKLT